MLLTTKGRYAVAAVLELAQSSNNIPVKLATVAQKQNIPLSYLEQIFVKLKKASIVESVKGPGGGYILVDSPNTISIAMIIDAVEENIEMSNCKIKNTINCRVANNIKCNSHFLWEGLTKHIRSYFEGITIYDVTGKHKENLLSSSL